MIKIINKEKCCGCTACMVSCPKKCISMQEDEEGFLYPLVDEGNCIDCGLCEKVCPVIHPEEKRIPENVFAAVNLDESVRHSSSSGGVFTLLANDVIKTGGVVFGAELDTNLKVKHVGIDNVNDLSRLQGSKYVQSFIGTSFSEVKEYLQKGRKVLFSGTPCQVSGLNRYLRKPYDNLITVDCLCHGVPSPMIWRRYIKEKLSECKVITSVGSTISFRDKSYGWNEYNLSVNGTTAKEKDLFLKGMTERLFLRPICYKCPFREQRSHSQLTLGDFWGIEHRDARFADNKGTSLVLVNDAEGLERFNSITQSLIYAPKSYEEARKTCSMIYRSCTYNPKREEFFKMLNTYSVTNTLQKLLPKEGLKSKFKSLMKESMRRKIIFDAPGQTCNRLWSYLDTIGWAVANKKKVIIWHWDSSIKYFDILRHNPYVSFPLYNRFIIRLFGEKCYRSLLNKTLTQRYVVKLYKSKVFRKIGFVSGWEQRASFTYYPRVIDKVKSLYMPNDEIVKETSEKINAYKKAGYFIVGVHIRGGDYKTWEGGKYYFSQEEYALLMDQIDNLYADRKVMFFISTNEKLNAEIFKGKILAEMNNQTAIHDLYTLSLCDRIIGPLSTFSRWASFYGQVPLLFIERNQEINSDSQFSVITDFYHFADGREIVNLSDRK